VLIKWLCTLSQELGHYLIYFIEVYCTNLYTLMGMKGPCESDSNNSVNMCWAKYKLNYHIYSNARSGFFHTFGAQICGVILNLCMKCWTAPLLTRLLWTGPWGQTMACIAKSFCKISAVLRYYAALSGKSFTNITGQPISPICNRQEIQKKRECSTLTPSSFLGLNPSS
jgi:hypothetical protein